ncbi:MAG: T9SS type A sorting domain-containing protein [bacterium]
MKRIISLLFFLSFAISLMAQTDVYTPTLKTPEDSATNMVPNVILSWNAIAGSTGLQYQVQIDTSANFNSPLKVDTIQTLLTGFRTHELIFGQTYYWRVRAIDLGQTSYWSTVWSFVVFDQVTLSKPTNLQIDQVPDVNLEWKNTVSQDGLNVAITGVKYWDYQYDSVETFNSPAFKEGTMPFATLKVATSNLRFGQKYYYRVRARHNLSTSSWCEPWGFTVVDKITLQAPNDAAVSQMMDAQIRWKNVTGILGYEYQLASDAGFSNVIVQSEVDTNQVKCSLLQFGQKIYWRVRARQLHDTSSWSNSRSFTVINTVVLKSPADAQQDVALKPSLLWTSQTGISGFELQIDSLNTFASPVVDAKIDPADVSYAVSKKLKNLKTYYWRMRAFSDGGAMADTSDWSAPWSFTTIGTQGIGDKDQASFTIFPNPASDKVTLKIESSEARTILVSIVDLIGKTIISREFQLFAGMNSNEIPLENINKGVYILRLTIGGQTLNRKVIVDR